jgi:hypothetical protein
MTFLAFRGVYQAFKEVEVAVRKAANSKGAGYQDDLAGTTLMRRAFLRDTGPLRNTELVPAECEAEMHLFAGCHRSRQEPDQPSRCDACTRRGGAPQSGISNQMLFLESRRHRQRPRTFFG